MIFDVSEEDLLKSFQDYEKEASSSAESEIVDLTYAFAAENSVYPRGFRGQRPRQPRTLGPATSPASETNEEAVAVVNANEQAAVAAATSDAADAKREKRDVLNEILGSGRDYGLAYSSETNASPVTNSVLRAALEHQLQKVLLKPAVKNGRLHATVSSMVRRIIGD